MNFSERNGYSPRMSRAFQREEVDPELRTALWNLIKKAVWNKLQQIPMSSEEIAKNGQIHSFCEHYWGTELSQDLDTLPHNSSQRYDIFKAYFFQAAWFSVLDFLELVVEHIHFLDELFLADVNRIFEKHNSVYRLVRGKVIEITNQTEIVAISSAQETGAGVVRAHLSKALNLLSDRLSPDYPNSIKESISAVEAILKKIVGNDSASLSKALSDIRAMAEFHPALLSSIEKIYAYTSDAKGIRHAAKDGEAPVLYQEAKLILVVCSAFVSFFQLHPKVRISKMRRHIRKFSLKAQ